MHKLLGLSTITGCLLLIISITSIAFENNNKGEKINIVYEVKSILDDYVLNYCSTYDSYTVNRLYSQKKIFDEKNNINLKNKFIVSIKKKPINPNIIEFINEKPNFNIANLNINEIDLDYLSKSKKDFVKTLLPLISYENQNILLERSKLENMKIFLDDNNTLSKADLDFLYKISKKYRIKTNDRHKYDLVNELLYHVDVIPNSIVLAHDLIPLRYPSMSFLTLYHLTYVPLILKQSKLILCNSISTANDLNTFYKVPKYKLFPIRLGFSNTKYYPIKKIRQKFFLIIGRHNPHKNLERVIKAFSLAKLNGYKLVFVGSFDRRYTPGLMKTIDELNIRHLCVWRGWIDDQEKLIQHMSSQFIDMLRENFSDPNL